MSPDKPAAPSTAQMRWVHLEVHRHGALEMRFPLPGKSIIAGRVIECDVQLDDASVSRKHARFEPVGEGFWRVVDQKSRNKTRVNGTVQDESLITHGDRVEIGPFTLILCNPAIVKPAEDIHTEMPASRLTFSDQAVSINTLKEIEPPTIAVDQLHLLNEFSRIQLETPDAHARLVALCRLMLHPKLGGIWAVVASMNPSAAEAVPKAMLPIEWASPSKQASHAHLSRSLLRAACQRQEPVLASNTANAPGGGIELSIAADVMAMSAVAVPLALSRPELFGQPVEVLYAVFPPRYGTGEWLALCTLAVHHHRQAGIIWSNIERNRKLAALERDLERARRVQAHLVPRRPNLQGLELAVRFKPCHAVGGDYVDALRLPDGQLLLVMADVCGKGLPAAMVAMGLHTLVHAIARRWVGLSDLVEAINAHLEEALTMESFVTLMAMTIDPDTGATESVNGGHPPAMIVQTDGQLRRLGTRGGCPLGLFQETIEIESGRLAADELLVLFTDGCFELTDTCGELMGADNFCEQAAEKIKGTTPDAAADCMTELLDQLQDASDLTDDRTMLVARRA